MRVCAALQDGHWQDINAEDLQLGDTLGYFNDQSNQLELTTLASAEKIWKVGIFNPLTAEGTMLVDHMYVSCYGQISPALVTYSHSLAHQLLSPALWVLQNIKSPAQLLMKPLAISYAGLLIWLNEYLGRWVEGFSLNQ